MGGFPLDRSYDLWRILDKNYTESRRQNMEQKNRFVLFSNSKGKETHPDFRGELNADDKIYKIAAWLKKDKNGNDYLSGTLEPSDKSDS